MKRSPTLLVADPNVRSRLRVVDTLRADFAVSIPGPGETPLRAVRRLSPELVLLAVPRGRAAEAVRTCRVIKTDSNHPPRVGLLDPRNRLVLPDQAVSAALADGYLGGARVREELDTFIHALFKDTRPIMRPHPIPNRLQRLIHRLLGK